MNKKMKIVVIGGTGLIGTKLVNNLRERGQEVVAASPSTGVNAVTGEGLAEALTGAQVVVDVTNAPSWEDKAVLEFFETSTRNVFAAEEKKAWATTFFAADNSKWITGETLLISRGYIRLYRQTVQQQERET